MVAVVRTTRDFRVGNGIPYSIVAAIILALACAVVIVAGFAVVSLPLLALGVIAPIGLVIVIRSAIARVAVLTLGGVLVLGSSTELTASKLGFLGACSVVLVISLIRMPVHSGTFVRKAMDPLILWSFAWVALIALSLPVAMRQGSQSLDWFRASQPYFLTAMIIPIVIDVSLVKNSRFAYRAVQSLFVVCGLLVTISWFLAWTIRRGFFESPIPQLSLWSFSLSIAFFTYGLSKAQSGAGAWRALWLSSSLFVVVMIGLTGTRQVLLVLVPAVIVFALDRTQWWRKLSRLILIACFAMLFVQLFLSVFVSYTGYEPDRAVERFSNLSAVTDTDQREGASFAGRVAVTDLAAEAFQSSPITGVGLGYRYSFYNQRGEAVNPYAIDTPLAYVANFGILGMGVVLLLVGCMRRSIQIIDSKIDPRSPEMMSLKAFLVFLAVYVLAGSPFEDKGLGMSLLFFMTLIFLRDRILREES